MAEATKKIVETRTYKLLLSEDEATALHDLLYAGVAGDQQTTRRKHFSAIRRALTSAGISRNDKRCKDIVGVVTIE